MFKLIHHISIVMLVLVCALPLCFDRHSAAQFPTGAPETILLVDGIAGSAFPPGLGNGWGNNAYLFLQDAITRANLPTVTKPVAIWVRGAPAGIPYRPDQGVGYTLNTRCHEFRMAPQVYLYGGFAGNEPITDAGFRLRDPANNVTILSGEIDNPSILTDNSYHILVAVEVPGNGVIDGFTISGGYSLNEAACPGLPTPLYFQGGSGLAMIGSGFGHPTGVAPHVMRCTFTNNTGIRGGAVFLAGGEFNAPTFINCQFIGNVAGDINVPPQVTGWGGAFFQVDNLVPEEDPESGARPNFRNCLFRNNFAENAGGAMYLDFLGVLRVYHSTMVNNVTRVAGGAIYHKHQDACGGTTCLKCGGINLQNSIIWGNDCTNCAGAALDQLSGRVGLTSTCVQDLNQVLLVCSSVNSTGADPQFVNPGLLDFRLGPGSPLIDMGDSDVSLFDTFDLNHNCDISEQTPDLDGRARLVRVTAATPVPDMGAYEFQDLGNCPGNVDHINGVGIDDLLAVVNAWGDCPPGFGCPADIFPACHDHTVNIDDLLVVINDWGCQAAVPPPPLDSVMDCINVCIGADDFAACVNRCVQGISGGG